MPGPTETVDLGGSPEAERPDDARRAVGYLVAPESDEYVAVMSVLEGSATDLTPAEVVLALRERGIAADLRVVEARLAKLREWGAASARSDQTHVRRVQDLLLRNFRYTATRHGRQVQRFYETVLAGTPVMREIPMQSLNAVVVALEALGGRGEDEQTEAWVQARVNEVFTAHDDLDSSLVGAEDTLMGLADRFDLDDDRTGELKTLLVGYATRVAVELDKGADRAVIALRGLTDRYAELARMTVSGSAAADLIGRDLLAASKGGDVRDWRGLEKWFDPRSGRSARFQARMVQAIPTFHANLRRLHTAGESGTSRARALLLARACLDADSGSQIYLAALGDHGWRKLHGEADDPGAGRVPPWREGPQVAVPAGLRSHGRAGVPGRAAAPLDDTAARLAVAVARQERLLRHQDQLREVLAAAPGDQLSDGAARVALAALLDAVRQGAVDGRRRASKDGLAGTVFWTGAGTGLLRAPSWRVWLPGRAVVFHAPADRPRPAVITDTEPAGPVRLHVEGLRLEGYVA
jgi:uncharacterized protein (TIGR02677 family)